MKNSIKSESMFDVINKIILFLFCFLCIYPFIYMLALSFNEGFDTMKGGITFYPRKFTLDNYITIFRDGVLLNAYKITLLRTIVGTFLSVLITGMVAFGLSERGLPGRRYIMFYLLVPMFFSGGLIPFYLTLSEYKLIDSFWVYILPFMFNIWNCIVMKTFFMSIPQSLKESLRIDGGTEPQIFLYIALPLSVPMLAAISLFVAVMHWNEWFMGAYFVHKTELLPVQTYLQIVMNREIQEFLKTAPGGAMINVTTTSFSIKVSAVILGVIPILILYPFLQKYFVKGVMVGSLKE